MAEYTITKTLAELKEEATVLDNSDELSSYRKNFIYPPNTTYLVGHSLGLPCAASLKYLSEVERQWKELAVESWWDKQEESPVGPWLNLEQRMQPYLAELFGCNALDVTATSGLGVNLHYLLHSLYKPQGKKSKIVCARSMFPQDRWILDQHVKLPGYEGGSILWLDPRPGEVLLREEDIAKLLQDEADSIALILLEAVSYVTSHAYNLQFIAQAAKKANVIFMVDVAHGAFVSPLQCNAWEIDAAVGCSYKFGCAGPGGLGLLYINRKHWQNPDLWRPGGWWGNNRATQFEMGATWQPAQGAAAWQVSTLPVLAAAPLLGALELFHSAGISRIHKKCMTATSYLIRGLNALKLDTHFRVLTPPAENAKAAEVAIEFKDRDVAKRVKHELRMHGVLVDYRESPFPSWSNSAEKPGILRAGIHPLFNSYSDVYTFIAKLGDGC